MTTESNDEKITKFYSNLINVVYGVVFGGSFIAVQQIIFPVDKLMSWNGITFAFGALFAYYFALSGWYGLHRSLIERNFKLETHVSKVRFAVNLLIIFLEVYLVALATGVIAEGINLEELNWSIPLRAAQAYEVFKENYVDIFTWLLPSIYITYIGWDLIKRWEYWKDMKEDANDPKKDQKAKNRNDLKKRALYTVCITFAFIVLAVIYSSRLHLITELYVNLWALIPSLGLVLLYRTIMKRYKETGAKASNSTASPGPTSGRTVKKYTSEGKPIYG